MSEGNHLQDILMNPGNDLLRESGENITVATDENYKEDEIDNIPDADNNILENPNSTGGKQTRKNKHRKSPHNLNYCPHMPVQNRKYAKITKSRPHILRWNGKKYRFYTCCKTCCKQMLDLAKSKPKTFEKTYISKIENGNLFLKHRYTHKVVQIAKKINDSHKKTNRTRKTKQNRKGKSKRTHKYRGGSNIRYGTGYGSNCNEPNFNIYNTNMRTLFPYKP
jgi:hypothetical protein